jgi:ribosomal protein L32E
MRRKDARHNRRIIEEAQKTQEKYRRTAGEQQRTRRKMTGAQ